MSTATTLQPPVRAAFDDLIDYAGLFPPARLPMSDAAAEYAAARAGPAAWMLGRFIVPASRVPELTAARQASGASEPITVSVIVDGTLDPRQWFGGVGSLLTEVARLRKDAPSVRIHALEVPLAPLLSARETFDAAIGQLGALIGRAGLRDLPVYVELPQSAQRRELLAGAMAALARVRFSAKLRCGGITAEAFPSVDDVAAFIAAAAEEGVAFKATAGLHHPARHVDAATGFAMHGFLNLLAAASFAPRLANDALSAIVAEEDARAFRFDESSFAWRDERAGVDDLKTMRASAFAGYGSCSFAEPVADLTALGLLPATA
ncbi:MAG: hypothetical protein ABI231_00980 [Candidatus Tumulicola sp.]